MSEHDEQIDELILPTREELEWRAASKIEDMKARFRKTIRQVILDKTEILLDGRSVGIPYSEYPIETVVNPVISEIQANLDYVVAPGLKESHTILISLRARK